MSDEYNTKVYMEQGGDRQVVKSGGEIKILTGGKIVPNSGTQAVNIADAVVATGLANNADVTTLVTLKTEHDALVTKLNAIIAALEDAGILASS